MKTKYILLGFAFFISASVRLFAQNNVEWDDKNFADRKAFKEANRHYEEGNDIFKGAGKIQADALEYFVKVNHYLPNGVNELGDGGASDGFKKALDEYIIANQFNPNSATLNYRMAVCYYNISSQKLMGLTYIEKAIQLNPNVDASAQYYLGRLEHLHANWDKAITAYRAYLTILNTNPSDNRDKIADMNRKIQECVTGKELQKNPQRVFIDNLGAPVNTSDPEYAPLITADESEVIFTSRRATSTGGKLDPDNQYYEDLYQTNYISGKWTPPVNMGKPINGEDHDATAGLSPDGQKLYIYRNPHGGDLYECELQGDHWTEPEHMNKNINSEGHESSVSLSFDGKKLYYISDKEGGIGNRDIWFSTMDPKGKWGPSTNMGAPINTIYGEEGVFVHPDGKTIYFSSQGHNTMGGYDIFKSEFKDGKWGEPENLGWPINGPDDDVFFVISANGKHGYFAANKADGQGEKDIYKITFLGPDKPLAMSSEDNLLAGLAAPVKNVEALKPVEIKTANVTVLKGTVTDKISHNPLGASIEIVDNTINQSIATFTANSASGKYLVTLPSGKNYGIYVKMDGYLFHSENFDIPVVATYQEVTKDIEMEKIAVGSTIVLRNVFFDYNKSTLKPESSQELDRLVKILQDNPTIRIELSGHTDSRGSDDGNQRLSEARAKSCVDYLVAHGIAMSRLEFKGYGESQPIATNDTEEGMALNRRTEFKILSK
jgi:outer membrane protein OmpA-like peptidoglycan-associated protein/tetratricopeptide (TPR) repeat protein